jgi:hypothetical protein
MNEWASVCVSVYKLNVMPLVTNCSTSAYTDGCSVFFKRKQSQLKSYFPKLSVSRPLASNGRVITDWRNWKGFGSVGDLIKVLVRKFPGGRRKTTKISVRIASIPSEIRTENILSTIQESCNCASSSHMDSTIIWNVRSCSPIEFHRRLGGKYFIHLLSTYLSIYLRVSIYRSIYGSTVLCWTLAAFSVS